MNELNDVEKAAWQRISNEWATLAPINTMPIHEPDIKENFWHWYGEHKRACAQNSFIARSENQKDH